MTVAAHRFEPGRSREELRLVELASGLLTLLDAYRLTGRLPLEVQVQASRLRHAVKLAVRADAARTATRPPTPLSVTSQDPAAALRAWIATQPWVQPGPVGWVYLLCFRDPATGHHAPLVGNGCRGQYAGHYWGWTDDLLRRITKEHRNPRWRGAGRLVQVALAAGLTFELAWCEYPATRGRERRLKNQGSAYRRCPLCRGTGGPSTPPPPWPPSTAPRSPNRRLLEGGNPHDPTHDLADRHGRRQLGRVLHGLPHRSVPRRQGRRRSRRRRPRLRTRHPPRPPPPTAGLTRGPPLGPGGAARSRTRLGRTRRPPPTR
jgi:hypothetical protein